MTATVAWLLGAGIAALQAGLALWLVLILWTLFREGDIRRFTGWSISGQWAELACVIGLAGRGGVRRVLSRIASIGVALGAGLLALAGIVTLIRLFTQAPAA